MKKKTKVSSKKVSSRSLKRPIRFTPDPLTIAVLFSENSPPSETLSIVGLVLNESFGGCAILINHDGGLKKDLKLKIKVGQLSPMRANVIWVKNLEESIYKVGLKFLE